MGYATQNQAGSSHLKESNLGSSSQIMHGVCLLGSSRSFQADSVNRHSAHELEPLEQIELLSRAPCSYLKTLPGPPISLLQTKPLPFSHSFRYLAPGTFTTFLRVSVYFVSPKNDT